MARHKAKTAIAALLAAMAVASGSPAQTAGGPHLLGYGELQPAPPPRLSHVPPRPPVVVPRAKFYGSFVLRRVVVLGASSIPPAQLPAAWQAQLGQRVDATALSAIAQRLGRLEAKAGIALYRINFSGVDRAAGIVGIRVTEGAITRIAIVGTAQGARLGLLRAYTNAILHSRPLRETVLERQILLMGDIAGAKIGSTFLPVAGHPDQTELLLDVSRQKFFGGFGLNNEGTPILDETQLVANIGVNNLFHEGERTQIVAGLPIDINSYHYYGINDIEPVGDDGAVLSLNAGQLVSNPYHDNISGNAQVYGARLAYPLIRSVHTNINVSLGLDALNSSNGFLGYTVSDERTRAVRAGVTYSNDQYFQGINAVQLSASEGVDILGARRAGPAFGGPDFTKGNVTIERLQALPKGFALRLAFTGQITGQRLPPSEEFEYGGPDCGLAFTAAALTGDEGITGLAQLAHALPPAWLPKPLGGTAVFLLADYGEVWNRGARYVQPTDRGASFAAGVKFLLLGKVALTLAAATPIVKPLYAGSNEHWRFVLNTTGTF